MEIRFPALICAKVLRTFLLKGYFIAFSRKNSLRIKNHLPKSRFDRIFIRENSRAKRKPLHSFDAFIFFLRFGI